MIIKYILAAMVSAAPLYAETVVMLPFDNLSGTEGSGTVVAKLVTDAIAARGWKVVGADQIEPVLESARVRYVDSLDPDVRQNIAKAAFADALLSLTIETYAGGRNPIVALSARLIRGDGTLAWCDVAGLSAEETERILGFGRTNEVAGVAEHAVRLLMRRFPAPGQIVLVRGPSKPLLRSGPVSYRNRDAKSGAKKRICILPFDNLSSTAQAPRIVSEVLTVRLAATGAFDVVEPAAMRAAALQARIGSFRGIDSEQLAKLADAVGTPLFLSGTIYTYVDPSSRAGGEPEVSLELSLVDIRTHRVLWLAQHARKGTDYIGWLMLGNVTNAVSLTDRVIAEVIQAEEKR